MKKILIIFSTILLASCVVGPDYKRAPVLVTAKFKEAPPGWKLAHPCDELDRGDWWTIFNDPHLNTLEHRLNISNQNIAQAVAQYREAIALVAEARAAYFPFITASATINRQKASAGFISGGSTNSVGTFTSYAVMLNALWEPDLWGSVRRQVEAAKAGAQATAAQLANVRLSMQASLAQFYFELRAVDTDQKLLQRTVVDYKKSLQITLNKYNAGTVGRGDVVQAQSQLQTAQSQLISYGVTRAQYEHAIAVLIGLPPAAFAFPRAPLNATPPQIPVVIPSQLLERRPDIAQAERLMAQANAQIGVAVAAFFPTLPLTASGQYASRQLSHLFTQPSLGWGIGAQLLETIFSGGLRHAQLNAAKANYEASVAAYRQVVLTAFQDVEDNLAALRILAQQAVVQNQAAASARHALRIVMNEYKAGTVEYSNVLIAQTTAYTAEKSAADITGLRMSAAVGLMKALGGGWNTAKLPAVDWRSGFVYDMH